MQPRRFKAELAQSRNDKRLGASLTHVVLYVTGFMVGFKLVTLISLSFMRHINR